MSENTTTNQFEDSPNLSAEASLPFDGFDVELSESSPATHRPFRSLRDDGTAAVAVGENPFVDPEVARAAYSREEGRLAYRFLKRAFDIVFSLGVIAVLLVPSLLLCLAIRLESPGCPIYSQKRVGRIGRSGEVETFDMYKFRSMHKDADARLAGLKDLNEADGPLFKIKDDPRVTRIGRFIRKHSIDELPQFANCLLGQMSLVGHWPTRLDHIGFAPLRSVWGFARPCLPETGKTNRHKSVQRLRGFLRPRELRVPNQAPALKGMAPSAMVCRARSLTAEE